MLMVIGDWSDLSGCWKGADYEHHQREGMPVHATSGSEGVLDIRSGPV